MRVLLVTSNREECGIREYGRMLIEAVGLVDGGILVQEFPDPLASVEAIAQGGRYDIIHLNHHAALHSGWLPAHVRALQEHGHAVVVTQHDTFETWGIMADRGLPDFRGADALFVHEPVRGLTHDDGGVLPPSNVHYIHQPVPLERPAPLPRSFGRPYGPGPVVGTVGFAFPWKNYELLCRAAKIAGWSPLIIAPGATVEQCQSWQDLCGERAIIFPAFVSRQQVVSLLGACDATAFLYNTGNSGTSGAVRMGIAAGRPCIVMAPETGNRQVRDLEPDSGIYWAMSEEDVSNHLSSLALDMGVLEHWTLACRRLAVRDSWLRAGERYAAAYRRVAGERARA